MFVRVYDKEENRFFKSMVYGCFGEWYCREMIVFNPGTKCFQLIENMYESGERVESSYEIINDNTEEWVSYEKAFLLKLKRYFKEHGASILFLAIRKYLIIMNSCLELSRKRKYR